MQIGVCRPTQQPYNPTTPSRVGAQIHEPAGLRMPEKACEIRGTQAPAGVLEPLHQQYLSRRGRRGLNTVIKTEFIQFGQMPQAVQVHMQDFHLRSRPAKGETMRMHQPVGRARYP